MVLVVGRIYQRGVRDVSSEVRVGGSREGDEVKRFLGLKTGTDVLILL